MYTDPEQINNEAREWFTLMQSGAVTLLQKQQLQQWLDADNAHKIAYRQFEMIWQDLGTIAKSDAANALKKSVTPTFLEKLYRSLATVSINIRALIQNKNGAFATAVIVTALSSLLFLNLNSREAVTVTQYSTQLAEIKKITLADGSEITLGAKTEIKTWTTAQERHVLLVSGQAFFKVAKDAQHPFWVNAADTAIKVVGTQFDVRTGTDRVRVAVSEGIVNVFKSATINSIATTENSPVVLTRGKQVTHLNKGNFETVNDISINELEAWRKGRLIYQRANLSDVIADANRYLDQPIVLDSKDLADLKVTAAVSIDQISSLNDMLSRSLPITIRNDNDHRTIISSRLKY